MVKKVILLIVLFVVLIFSCVAQNKNEDDYGEWQKAGDSEFTITIPKNLFEAPHSNNSDAYVSRSYSNSAEFPLFQVAIFRELKKTEVGQVDLSKKGTIIETKRLKLKGATKAVFMFKKLITSAGNLYYLYLVKIRTEQNKKKSYLLVIFKDPKAKSQAQKIIESLTVN